MIPSLNLTEQLEKQRLRDGRFCTDVDFSNLFQSPIELSSEELAKRVTRFNNDAINQINCDHLSSDRVYHIDSIRTIATTYRLRFLPLKYFKPRLPKEAFEKIREFELLHDTEVTNLQILAPSKLFKLENQDDPLLFAPIGNGYYYLIHQWGNDLNGLRKLLVWPLRGPIELVLTMLVFSYLLTLLVPNGMFSKQGSTAEFWILFFFFFKGVVGMTIFYGISMGKNFNPFIWNSKYFNA